MDAEIPMMRYQPAQSGETTNSSLLHNNTVSNNTTGSSSSTTTTTNMLIANESVVVRKAGRQAVCQFLESYNCFAVLKISTKVVVFDIRIPIQLAFYALVEHGAYVVLCILCVCVCLV
jgi:hypothetical protein